MSNDTKKRENDNKKRKIEKVNDEKEKDKPKNKKWFIFMKYPDKYEYRPIEYFGPYDEEDYKLAEKYDERRVRNCILKEINLDETLQFNQEEKNIDKPFFTAMEDESNEDNLYAEKFYGIFYTKKAFYEWILTKPFVNSAYMIECFRLLRLKQ